MLVSNWPAGLTDTVIAEARGRDAMAEGADPWDDWHDRALAEGLSDELAALGRVVMREAVARNWSSAIREECGWLDAGEGMLETASHDPEGTTTRWELLLSRDDPDDDE